MWWLWVRFDVAVWVWVVMGSYELTYVYGWVYEWLWVWMGDMLCGNRSAGITSNGWCLIMFAVM